MFILAAVCDFAIVHCDIGGIIFSLLLSIPIVFLWLAVLLFTVVSLLVKLVRSIVRRCKKQDNRIPMGRWSLCAAIVQAVLASKLAVEQGF